MMTYDSTGRPDAANATVDGRMALAVLGAYENGLGFFQSRARELLAANGIDAPSPTRTYDLDAVLGVFADLRATQREKIIRRVGKTLPHELDWADGVSSTAEAFATLDAVYADLHGGDAGGYEFERTGTEQGRLVCATPYPAEFEEGLFRGIAQRFSETGYIDVELVERRDGATTYDLTWWESAELDSGPTIDADAGSTPVAGD